MELRHLRYFHAVAASGSFSAAARQLHVAQSSVSEQIADLEAELGGSLLDRTGRRTRLTPMGTLFLAEANKTLLAAERAVEVTQRSLRGESGTLSIGFFLWGVGGFFPRIIREYRRRHPGIRLRLVEMHANEQVVALEEGQLDVGLTRPLDTAAERTLRSELLFEDPVVAAVRSDHPCAGREFPLEELATERLVLAERSSNPSLFDAEMAMFSAKGMAPQVTNTSTTWSGVLTLVEAGEGVALVPAGVKHLRTRGLVFCPLRPQTLSLGLSVAWNPRRTGAALDGFLRAATREQGTDSEEWRRVSGPAEGCGVGYSNPDLRWARLPSCA